MSNLTAREAWASALGSLQIEVTKHNYETYLKDTVGLGLSSDSFVVGVPTPFVAAALEKRLNPLVTKTLEGVLRHAVDVSYRVHREGTTDQEPAPEAPQSAQPARPRHSQHPSRHKQDDL